MIETDMHLVSGSPSRARRWERLPYGIMIGSTGLMLVSAAEVPPWWRASDLRAPATVLPADAAVPWDELAPAVKKPLV
jgi:hypothetical protein